MPTLQTLEHLYVPPVELADTSGSLWPKWVYPNGTKQPGVIVQDEEQEAAVLASAIPAPKLFVTPEHIPEVPVASSPPAEAIEVQNVVALDSVPNERDYLVSLATERGVKIDKRWKTEKIKAALEG